MQYLNAMVIDDGLGIKGHHPSSIENTNAETGFFNGYENALNNLTNDMSSVIENS